MCRHGSPHIWQVDWKFSIFRRSILTEIIPYLARDLKLSLFLAGVLSSKSCITLRVSRPPNPEERKRDSFLLGLFHATPLWRQPLPDPSHFEKSREKNHVCGLHIAFEQTSHSAQTPPRERGGVTGMPPRWPRCR